MSTSNIVKLEALHTIKALKLKLLIEFDITIPELDKVENIVLHENYIYDNTGRNLYSAYRRLQEIGIYDDEIDSLFGKLYKII